MKIFQQLVPELEQHSAARELSSKALPTLKHVILTGEQKVPSGIHSYQDLLQRGANSHMKDLVNVKHQSILILQYQFFTLQAQLVNPKLQH